MLDSKLNGAKGSPPGTKRTTNIVAKHVWEARYLYILLLPLVAYYVVFHYYPMYGIIIAFKEYSFSKGILGSPWVGLKQFESMFSLPQFIDVLKNTLILAAGRIVIEFPIPIIFALLLNEVRRTLTKRFYQTVFTFPHFLSWVIVSGILINFLSDSGVLNQLLQYVGLPKMNLLMESSTFRGLLFGTSIWKEMGWGTIIYLAAIAGIDPALYEAASIDGANRFQRMLKITWPSIRGTAAVLFILQVGNIMNGAGFDQIFNMYHPGVYEVSDILDTFIYRTTFYEGGSFSFSTAVGVFKSAINCILLIVANQAVKRMGQGGLM
ncbi:putative multiple-sugar transport system permease YteP [Paenibacillus sp. J23TS9]|uniref:ABC transporter permease n=1 Tax=Paenibacillus sp. J23TS9 TaxID=2807193 RepID=UPI001AFE9E30|nr:ABC transporter permease subunit [Paenibacillus sp. J23TS9]GIP28530.1 putative multiple-sugar transport system permease YteP [Paenibacillus sp. J23TS9]